MDKDKIISGVGSLGFTMVTALFGGWDVALNMLFSFMLADYITGLIKGKVTNDLNSKIGFKGILRKATILIVLFLAVSLDRLISPDKWIFRTLICYFYIGNEGLSILENITIIGVPVPEGLKNALVQLRENKGIEKEVK